MSGGLSFRLATNGPYASTNPLSAVSMSSHHSRGSALEVEFAAIGTPGEMSGRNRSWQTRTSTAAWAR